MSIKLLPHNEELYSSIVNEMEKGIKSIFYSEGTGLGKSFIFMRLVLDNFIDKRILFVSYRQEIWRNIQSYTEFALLKNVSIDFKCFAEFNTDMRIPTYADLYDVIFIDECHHMCTDKQGKNVDKLCREMNRRGKYSFGFTATPFINNIWVDKEYFDTSCYGLDNYDAIAQGLLPKIDLVLANNNLEEVPKDMRARFTVKGSKSVLESIREEYKEITHWLAYFGSIEELNANENGLRSTFPEFKILKIYNGIDNIDDIKKEFVNSDEKVILMSVSMLLEGSHLSNVGGILLFRNVHGSHTYVQILGRLNKLYCEKAPVMIDITNSIIGLRTFGSYRSDRYTGERRTYERRDIFDVTSKGYRQIEMLEGLQGIKIKSYRGITWTSTTDLLKKLHVTNKALDRFLEQNSHWNVKLQLNDDSVKRFIDYILDKDKPFYRYKYLDSEVLACYFGVDKNNVDQYFEWNPDKSSSDYLESKLFQMKEIEVYGYKLYYKNYGDLSIQLGDKGYGYRLFIDEIKSDDESFIYNENEMIQAYVKHCILQFYKYIRLVAKKRDGKNTKNLNLSKQYKTIFNIAMNYDNDTLDFIKDVCDCNAIKFI